MYRKSSYECYLDGILIATPSTIAGVRRLKKSLLDNSERKQINFRTVHVKRCLINEETNKEPENDGNTE